MVAELFIQCVTEVQLMLPVWQEAASLSKERNVIGLEDFRFSAAPVHQCGHWEGCWLLVCSAAKKALCLLMWDKLAQVRGKLEKLANS